VKKEKLQKYADSTKAIEDQPIELAIIAVNNHYAGFGHAILFQIMIVIKIVIKIRRSLTRYDTIDSHT
jgi:hypothetical protein